MGNQSLKTRRFQFREGDEMKTYIIKAEEDLRRLGLL
jgi:hypothetical protein